MQHVRPNKGKALLKRDSWLVLRDHSWQNSGLDSSQSQHIQVLLFHLCCLWCHLGLKDKIAKGVL